MSRQATWTKMRVPGHIAGAVMAALLALIVSSQALALPTGDIEDEPESEWYNGHRTKHAHRLTLCYLVGEVEDTDDEAKNNKRFRVSSCWLTIASSFLTTPAIISVLWKTDTWCREKKK